MLKFIHFLLFKDNRHVFLVNQQKVMIYNILFIILTLYPAWRVAKDNFLSKHSVICFYVKMEFQHKNIQQIRNSTLRV